MKARPIVCLSGLLLLGSLCFRTGAVQPRSSDAPLVFLHVTVINPGKSSVESDRAVTISGNHIFGVSDSKNFHSPGHARIIDGSGQFLIPGLWDMHVHMAFGDWFPGGREIILPLLVANGVTGVRDMGGDIPVLFAWRKEIASGALIGPRIVISGPMLDGYLPGGKAFRFPMLDGECPGDAL
jgi:hypothetical protein